jgi:hypothetical protein
MSTAEITSLNRRRFLGASAVAAVSVAGLGACGSESTARATADPSTDGRLADVVFEAFKTHRVVGIGETHGLQNHHDLLDALLNDPRLPEVIDDIVIEFGNALYQDTIDRFIAGRPVDNVELREVWRNTTQSSLMTFDEPVNEQFFRTVRAVNWTRPPEKQIRVLAGDPPIDWSKITNRTELVRFEGSRDTHAASVVGRDVLAKATECCSATAGGTFCTAKASRVCPNNTLASGCTRSLTWCPSPAIPAASPHGSPDIPGTRSSRPPARGWDRLTRDCCLQASKERHTDRQ